MKFDYYYGIESEQFSFYRVPRLLIKDKRFKSLSSDAKLLYGLMLDRMALSMKNGWFDEKNRAYIIYTIDNVMEDLGCSKPTCIKIIKELDTETGIGLIERKKRGLGKPDIVYVKNLTTVEKNSCSDDSSESSVSYYAVADRKDVNMTGKENELLEVKNFYPQREKNFTSRGKEFLPTEVKEFYPNYTNMNYTNMNYINPSINQREQIREIDNDRIDNDNTYIDIIKDNIDYDNFIHSAKQEDIEMYEELFQLICEVVCVKRETIKISGYEYPYEIVKSKFLKLNFSHLDYVMECMKNTTTKICNIKAYMLTSLYNAPNTISHYYQQEVQHDMYNDSG